MVAREPLHQCGISSVMLGELECGFLKSDRRPENRGKLNQLLGAVAIYDIDADAARIWAELQVAMRASLAGPNDMWIASRARVRRPAYHQQRCGVFAGSQPGCR